MDFGLIGIGSALAFAAMGSALGSGTAGMAAVGAWKRAFIQNKPAPFLLVAFVGAPLSQIFYGLILMNTLDAAAGAVNPGLMLGAGVAGGIAMGLSAWFQGRAAASACDSYVETGKGFGQNLIVIGIVETTALLPMVFLLGLF